MFITLLLMWVLASQGITIPVWMWVLTWTVTILKFLAAFGKNKS